MMGTYTSENLRDELAQVLPADEYDLDAITDELISIHGLRILDDMDDYAEVAIRHQIEPTDVQPAFITAIQQAITTTPEGATAVWESAGVRVEIYGQSRARTDIPTVGARITVITDTAVEVTPSSWAALWRVVSDEIDARQAETDHLLSEVTRAHARLQKAQQAVDRARVERDKLIRDLVRQGVSDYRIAATLSVAQTTVAAIRKKS